MLRRYYEFIVENCFPIVLTSPSKNACEVVNPFGKAFFTTQVVNNASDLLINKPIRMRKSSFGMQNLY